MATFAILAKFASQIPDSPDLPDSAKSPNLPLQEYNITKLELARVSVPKMNKLYSHLTGYSRNSQLLPKLAFAKFTHKLTSLSYLIVQFLLVFVVCQNILSTLWLLDQFL